jgi:hypothetical protein
MLGTNCRILIIFAVYVRCALARTGSLQTVCASSNRSAAWRFGSQGAEAHRRPRGRCTVDALLAACEEVAAKTACEVAKCDQCGCGGSSATGDRFEQTSCDLCAWFRSFQFSLQCSGAVIAAHVGRSMSPPRHSAFSHVQAAVHEGEVSGSNPDSRIQSGLSDSGVPTQHRRQRPYAHYAHYGS